MSGGSGSTTIQDTAQQKALASIAAQRYNLYQQYYVPLENEYIKNIQAMTDPAAFESVEGYVTAMQQPQMQAARVGLDQQAFQRGIDPQSGQYQARAEQLSRGQARGMGLGTAEALSGQVDRYYQGLQNVIAMGQGQAGQAVAGMADVAELGQRRAISEAQSAFTRGQAQQSIIGTGLGFGAGLYMTGARGQGGGTGNPPTGPMG